MLISPDPLWYLLLDVTECLNSHMSGKFGKDIVQQQDAWASHTVLIASLPCFVSPAHEHIARCLQLLLLMRTWMAGMFGDL
jgi:hypothetical protein